MQNGNPGARSRRMIASFRPVVAVRWIGDLKDLRRVDLSWNWGNESRVSVTAGGIRLCSSVSMVICSTGFCTYSARGSAGQAKRRNGWLQEHRSLDVSGKTVSWPRDVGTHARK